MTTLPWKAKAKGLNRDIKNLLDDLRHKNKKIDAYEAIIRRQSVWIVILLLASIGSWVLFLWK